MYVHAVHCFSAMLYCPTASWCKVIIFLNYIMCLQSDKVVVYAVSVHPQLGARGVGHFFPRTISPHGLSLARQSYFTCFEAASAFVARDALVYVSYKKSHTHTHTHTHTYTLSISVT